MRQYGLVPVLGHVLYYFYMFLAVTIINSSCSLVYCNRAVSLESVSIKSHELCTFHVFFSPDNHFAEISVVWFRGKADWSDTISYFTLISFEFDWLLCSWYKVDVHTWLIVSEQFHKQQASSINLIPYEPFPGYMFNQRKHNAFTLNNYSFFIFNSLTKMKSYLMH